MEPVSALVATSVVTKTGEGLVAAASVETVKAAGVTETVASVGKGTELAGALQAIPQICVSPGSELGKATEVASEGNGVSGFDFNNPGFEFSANQFGIDINRAVEGLSASDLQQIGEMRELYAENWNALSVDGRREALQALENTLAKIQGREACEIVVDDMPSVVNCGFYRRADLTIHVNKIHLEDVDYRMEAIDTIAHEGRHAYQHWAVETPYFHPDMKEVAYWSENIDHYIKAEKFGFEYYESQPIEVDARRYAGIVKATLEVGESINGNGVTKVVSSVGDDFAGAKVARANWTQFAKDIQSKTIKETVTDAATSIRDFILEHTSPSARRAALIALAHASGKIRI